MYSKKNIRWRKAKQKREEKSKKVDEVLENNKIVYAKFMSRFFAIVMDMFMIVLPVNVVTALIFGMDSLKNPETASAGSGIFQMVLLIGITVLFWFKTGETPGKKAFQIRVVDGKTFEQAPIWKLILRYISYFFSLVTIIGFFLPLFRKDRKALHDLISGTAVIENRE